MTGRSSAWDGYGWISGSPSVAVLILSEPTAGAVDVPPAFPPEIMSGPRVSLPERDYILFEGPLAAAKELGWWSGELLATAHPELDLDDFVPQSPNLCWPQDRSWCFATDVGLDSTYVGGSRRLVNAVMSDQRFEAWPAQLADRVDAGADQINRQPREWWGSRFARPAGVSTRTPLATRARPPGSPRANPSFGSQPPQLNRNGGRGRSLSCRSAREA